MGQVSSDLFISIFQATLPGWNLWPYSLAIFLGMSIMPSISLLCLDIFAVKSTKLHVGLVCCDILTVKSHESSLIGYISISW